MNDQPRYILERLNEHFGYFLTAGPNLAAGRTRFQDLEVFETPMFGRMLRLDQVFMTSEKDEFFYHENLIHVGGIAVPEHRSALVIGGGDGGSVEELLKYRSMGRVVLAELDEGVVDAARKWLPEVHRGAFDDPRLEVKITDGRAFIEESGETFDQIVLDLTDPHGPSQPLYTADFYAACRRALTPDGVLSLHAESPIARPETWRRILASLEAAFPLVRPYLVYVPIYGTLWGMVSAASRSDPLTLTEEEVDRRIAERGLHGLQYYNGATHRAVHALPNFVRELAARPGRPITAEDPLDDTIAINQETRLRIVPAAD